MASKITSSGTSSEKNLLNFISSSPESFFSNLVLNLKFFANW